jgi:hypothetical protein
MREFTSIRDTEIEARHGSPNVRKTATAGP